jgi:NADH-quinone oxidoreductase subunit H
LSLQGIVAAQAHGRLFSWSGIAEPYVLPQAAGLIVAVIALTAVTGSGPFKEPAWLNPDRGWSGLRLVLWRGAQLATLLAGSAVIASLYLGGWAWPGHTSGAVLDALGPVLLAIKTLVVAVAILMAGLTLPHAGDDRFPAIAWRWLVPLALTQLVITACLKVAL